MKLWVRIGAWVIFAGGVITLLIMIRNQQDARILQEPKIIIDVEGENAFLTDKELLHRLRVQQLVFEGQRKDQLDIDSIEAFIEGISQVRDVSVYTAIGNEWQIDVSLKEPLARVYNLYGESFYVDEEGNPMETTGAFTARVPIFNGEIRDRISSPDIHEIRSNDSLRTASKLDDIHRIANYLNQDDLFGMMIGQVYLEKNGDFILVPLVGDQKIVFGAAGTPEIVREKFEKLKVFYEEAMSNVGWNTYSEIILKYDGQIVGKKRPES